jgi:hypothetical protein
MLANATIACPVTATTKAVIYHGVGATSECRQWESDFYKWAGIEAVPITAAQLKAANCGGKLRQLGVSIFAMPGGNAYDEQRSSGAEGKANLLSFLSSGGLYVGTCAGFYYASSAYWWEADRDGGEYVWPNLLGVFPEVEGSISSIIDDEDSPGYKLTALDNGLHAIYWGGPTRGWKRTPATVPGTVLARFTSIPGSLPAAVHVDDKDGNRLLFSAHFEAEEGVGIFNTGLTPAQTLANWQYRAAQIKKAAGFPLHTPRQSPVSWSKPSMATAAAPSTASRCVVCQPMFASRGGPCAWNVTLTPCTDDDGCNAKFDVQPTYCNAFPVVGLCGHSQALCAQHGAQLEA